MVQHRFRPVHQHHLGRREWGRTACLAFKALYWPCSSDISLTLGSVDESLEGEETYSSNGMSRGQLDEEREKRE